MSSVVEVLGRRKNVHLCVAGGGVGGGKCRGPQGPRPSRASQVPSCLAMSDSSPTSWTWVAS